MRLDGGWCVAVILCMAVQTIAAEEVRPRARELGIAPGIYRTGTLNAITDVKGIRVGHVTLIEGSDVRTGVTVILPHGDNVFQNKVPAAVYVANAFGKMAGSTQIQELGNLETPIVLTNTLSVGTAMEAVVAYVLNLPGNEDVRSVNAVVGETNDGGLNDIRGRHVSRQDVLTAISNAFEGPVEEGAVGAGTGTRCLGYKGGIGTSSRQLPHSMGGYMLGVLVQTNYGGILEIDGIPVAEEWGTSPGKNRLDDQPEAGSCMIVVATDAPMLARNLERLAKRAVLGLAKTGSSISNGSGDFVIAFSTNPSLRIPYAGRGRLVGGRELSNRAVSPLFQAVKEAVEEAVYNSLLRARTVVGYRGHRVEAVPIDRLKALIKKFRLH